MLRVVAVVSLCVVMFFPPLTHTVFFRWGTVTLTFPPYRFYCRPSRPPKLCSRLHKYTMFRNVCQVADYINIPCFGSFRGTASWGDHSKMGEGGRTGIRVKIAHRA